MDTQTNKKVAIKIFDNLDETLEEIEEDYAVISTHWIHPNIPHFSGLFLKKGLTRPQDQIWLVMELCNGGSVSELVLVSHDKLTVKSFQIILVLMISGIEEETVRTTQRTRNRIHSK